MASNRVPRTKAANNNPLNTRAEAAPVRVQPPRAQGAIQPRAAQPSASQKHQEEDHNETENGKPDDARVATHEHEGVAPPQSENKRPVPQGEGAAVHALHFHWTPPAAANQTREPKQPNASTPAPHVPGDAPLPTEQEVLTKLAILEPHQYDLTSTNEAFADWLRAFKDEGHWPKIEAALRQAGCVPQIIAWLGGDVKSWATSSTYNRFMIKSSWMRIFYVFETFTADFPTTLDDVFDPTWFAPFANDEGWTSTWRIAKLARSYRILSPDWPSTTSAHYHAWARAHNHEHNPAIVDRLTRRGTAMLKALKNAYGRGSLHSTNLPWPSVNPPLGTGATYWMAFVPYGTHLPLVNRLLNLDLDCDKKPRPPPTYDVLKCALETLQVLEFGPDILDCPPSDDKLTPDILAAHIVWLRLDAALKLRGGRDPELQLEQRKIRDFILEGGLTAVDPTTDLRWKIILVHLKKSHRMACDVLNASSSPTAVSPPHRFPANTLALQPEPTTAARATPPAPALPRHKFVTPSARQHLTTFVTNDTVPSGELPALPAHASPRHEDAAKLPSRLETLLHACASDCQAVGSNTPQAVELLDRVSNFVVDFVDIVGTMSGLGDIRVRNHLSAHLGIHDLRLKPRPENVFNRFLVNTSQVCSARRRWDVHFGNHNAYHPDDRAAHFEFFKQQFEGEKWISYLELYDLHNPTHTNHPTADTLHKPSSQPAETIVNSNSRATQSINHPHSLPHRLSGDDLDAAIAQRHDRAAAPTPVQHKATVLVRSAVVKDDAPVPSTASDTVVVTAKSNVGAAKGGASSKQRKDAKQLKATETKPTKDAKAKTKPKINATTAAREVIELSEPEKDDDISLVASATPDPPAVKPPPPSLPQAAAPVPTRTPPRPRASLANNPAQYAWLKQALTVPPGQTSHLQRQDDDEIVPRQDDHTVVQDVNQIPDRVSNKRPAVDAADNAPPAKKVATRKS